MTILRDRSMTGPVEVVDKNTISGVIVPWNTDATVVDFDHDGRPDRYVEAWSPGAFDDQALSGNRGTLAKIEMVETHSAGLGKIGYALELDNRPDGEHGLFRVMPRFRDDVLQMVEDGIDGLSIRFHEKRGGVITSWAGSMERRLRTAAQLVHVALVAEPAYADARIMAMREQADEMVDERRDLERQAEAARLFAELEENGDRWANLS